MPGNFYGLPFWLEQYDMMMRGEGHLRPEKPLLQLYMETRWQSALTCDDSYVQDVEALWLLTQVTQIRGHLAILNAEQILGDDTPIPNINARALMEERKAAQEKLSGAITCSSFQVANALNLHKCEASHLGFGLIPFIAAIELQCQPGYYPNKKLVTCPTETIPQEAKCEACNCDLTGSKNTECDDITGKCSCKDGFYGDKCENRNCDGHWDSWGLCDCGSNQTQNRSWLFTHSSTADGHCQTQEEEQECFSQCCDGQFDCGGSTCLEGSVECNYK